MQPTSGVKWEGAAVRKGGFGTLPDGKTRGTRMGRTLQKQFIRVQAATFADWCAEVRDLAGERWPEVSDQAPTLYAVWGGGATPQQALYMIGLILPTKAAAA
jgi:hypothetical protein